MCCSAVQCAGVGLGDGQLESLSHVFLHCPVVQPALSWTGAEQWMHYRVLFCWAVWHLQCCRAAEGQAFTAATVVALVTSWVQRAIRLDWLHVTTDLAGATASLPSQLVRCSRSI